MNRSIVIDMCDTSSSENEGDCSSVNEDECCSGRSAHNSDCEQLKSDGSNESDCSCCDTDTSECECECHDDEYKEYIMEFPAKKYLDLFHGAKEQYEHIIEEFPFDTELHAMFRKLGRCYLEKYNIIMNSDGSPLNILLVENIVESIFGFLDITQNPPIMRHAYVNHTRNYAGISHVWKQVIMRTIKILDVSHGLKDVWLGKRITKKNGRKDYVTREESHFPSVERLEIYGPDVVTSLEIDNVIFGNLTTVYIESPYNEMKNPKGKNAAKAMTYLLEQSKEGTIGLMNRNMDGTRKLINMCNKNDGLHIALECYEGNLFDQVQHVCNKKLKRKREDSKVENNKKVKE